MYKEKLFKLLFISVLIPLSIYLFILVPFSSFIDTKLISNINFFAWSSMGLIIFSAFIMSIFVVSLESNRVRNLDYFASLYVSKISVFDIGCSMIFWSMLITFFQFLASMTISLALVPEFSISIVDFFIFLFLSLSVSFFFCSFFVMIYIVFSDSIFSKIIITIFLVFFFGFGTGLFIPATEEYYTIEYMSILDKIPIKGMIENFQSIVLNKEIFYFNTAILILISVMFSSISIYFLDKRNIR